jgi:DDE domain
LTRSLIFRVLPAVAIRLVRRGYRASSERTGGIATDPITSRETPAQDRDRVFGTHRCPGIRKASKLNHIPVIDSRHVVSQRRDTPSALRFFMTALRAHGEPVEVVTDRAPALRAAIDELLPVVFHNTEQYANNRVECDHGRLKARLRPMRGLKRDHSARVIMRGHALMQNVRRGHYELGFDTRTHRRIETRSLNSPARSERETGGDSVPRGTVPLNATVPTEQPPAKRNPAIAR